MRQQLFAIALLAPLLACAAPSDRSAGSTPSPELGASLAQLTLADLQNAAIDAKAHDDAIAAMCYGFLAGEVTRQAAGQNSAISGPISAFQRLRDIQQAAGKGISQNFQINCAPLLSDTQANLLKLGALSAGVAGALP